VGGSLDDRAGPGSVSSLRTLAERLGIEPEFRDARGQLRQVPEPVQRGLLRAMGMPAEDDAQAADALDRLESEAWGAAFPPVLVVRAGTTVGVDLVLAEDTGEFSWRLRLDDGSERFGSADFQALEWLDTKTRDGRKLARRRLELGADLSLGYHRLSLGSETSFMQLIVVPDRCWLPEGIAQGRRYWGVSAQLYLLRSSDNWGIGDFTDLRHLIEIVGPAGADIVGVNPLHAMFPDNPEHASPYSPATRLLLNVLNIDVAAIPELAHSPAAQRLIGDLAFQQRLAACRDSAKLRYTDVAALKLPVLGAVFAEAWPVAGPERAGALQAFRSEAGETLERACLFLALRAHFVETAGSADWHNWPQAFRDVRSPAVAQFARDHPGKVAFQVWLQFVADEQLGAAARAASGMAVGIYRDLAVGSDSAGAETWCNPAGVVTSAQVGCPPDIYNPAGQDWGLPPFHPVALQAEAYRSFIDLVRANMRHAGALRIDHVMALQHLYWVPRGSSPADGGYVRYPMNDLIGILALESQRHRCLIVGEDLGTVPEGFRERMEAANILSYRVMFFEKDPGRFHPPGSYPRLALAVAGSHDLPTLKAWWTGSDIDLRESLKLFPAPEGAREARDERQREREQLLAALADQHLSPAEGEDVAEAVHAFLARSNAGFAVVQLDDITGEIEPVNVPTTSDQHPNWRRRLSLSLDELDAGGRLTDIARLFKAERAS
jgi:4-alpha-glucanotransferase